MAMIDMNARLGRILMAGLIAVAIAAPSVPMIASKALAKGPESVADLAEALSDAVVNISTSQTVKSQRSIPMPRVPEGSPFQEFLDEFFNRRNKDNKNNNNQGRPRKVQSLGSGFVIDPSGIIITNNHVIEGADEVTVTFTNDEKLVAKIIGRDKKTDIAVLKVEPKKPLTSVQFGDSKKLRVGDWVMAIGNPFGLGGTVTVGIVSARNRNINSGPYDNFIQTDAAINRGNSGGPLFDMEGRVVGINTAIISPSGGSIGIGFAIPTEIATAVIDQLRNFGETKRGWLGVRIQQVTDEIAEGLAMGEARGALVAGVTASGPADKSGVQPGDVILEFDGKPVKRMRDLPRMVADTPVGKAVDVLVLRKGNQETISVTLGRLEEGEKLAAKETGKSTPKVAVTKSLGLTLSEITEELRTKHNINADVKGVIITSVEPGSAAAEKRIQPGDIIVEVAQEPVTNADDVANQVDKLEKDGRKTALLLLSNGKGELRFVAVRMEDKKE